MGFLCNTSINVVEGDPSGSEFVHPGKIICLMALFKRQLTPKHLEQETYGNYWVNPRANKVKDDPNSMKFPISLIGFVYEPSWLFSKFSMFEKDEIEEENEEET